MCDPNYSKVVSCNDFKNKIASHKMEMNAGAINRLLQVLDEDCSGEISWKELTFALDIYKC